MFSGEQVDIEEAWTRVAAGECLYHMATTNILSYCVFDTVIDLTNEAATAAIEAEQANALNGTNANGTVVSSDVSETTWFEGKRVLSQEVKASHNQSHIWGLTVIILAGVHSWQTSELQQVNLHLRTSEGSQIQPNTSSCSPRQDT